MLKNLNNKKKNVVRVIFYGITIGSFFFGNIYCIVLLFCNLFTCLREVLGQKGIWKICNLVIS